MKVLITTSGTGSRLGQLTQNRNKGLIKVGEKPAISHIIDNLLECAEKLNIKLDFVITVGHKSEQIVAFLRMAYPEIAFNFIKVFPYAGPGSSLLASIMKAKDELRGPFIFHACDMIPEGWTSYHNLLKTEDKNVFLSFHDNSYNNYNFIHKGIISYKFSKKLPSNLGAGSFAGVSYIKNHELFWICAESLMASSETNLGDCDVYNKMEINRLNSKTFTELFYDIGNPSSLKNALAKVGDIPTLGRKDEEIYLVNKKIIKFFSDDRKAILKHKRTKFIELSPETEYFGNFLSYRFVEGNTLRKFVQTNPEILSNFLKTVYENLYENNYIMDKEKAIKIKNDFLFNKTYSRLIASQIKFGYENINCLSKIKINGKNCKFHSSFTDNFLKDSNFLYHFHGDLVLDNIIYNQNSNKFTLIDWRENLGSENIEFGDVRYDLAKLYHSLIIDHETLKRGTFFLKEDVIESENGEKTYNIQLDLPVSYFSKDCKKILLEFSKEKFQVSEQEIKKIVGLIWISMSPLHDERMGRFLFWMGQQILNDI